MKRLIWATAAIIALLFAAQASAGGYAGSRYQKRECTYTKATNTLYCETQFTESTPTTVTMFVSDPTCVPSGTRVVQRTGTLVETFRVWDLYSGHVPLAKNGIGGDSAPVGDGTWQDVVDTDMGCLV
jgi:hypothetical protein